MTHFQSYVQPINPNLNTASLDILHALVTQAMLQQKKLNPKLKNLPSTQPLSFQNALVLAMTPETTIKATTDWFKSLVKNFEEQDKNNIKNNNTKTHNTPIRVYTDEEQQRLGKEGILVLDSFVQYKIFTAQQREILIHHFWLLTTEEKNIPMHHWRWILFVLLGHLNISEENMHFALALLAAENQHRVLH